MVDITVTAANVLASGQADKETGIAGVAITAGQPVYKEAATGQFKLTNCVGVGEARKCYGMALNAAGVGQTVTVAKSDPDYTPGATLTKGSRYYTSAAGAIAPEADLASLDELTLLFVATSTTKAWLRPWNTGVTI